jgi:putative transposase
LPLEEKVQMVVQNHAQLSVHRQCELLSLNRSSFYYQSQRGEFWSEFDYFLMKRIDHLYLQCPFYGSRRVTAHLQLEGLEVNRKGKRGTDLENLSLFFHLHLISGVPVKPS